MNTLRRQPDPAAEEQASLWAARLEGGTLSAADRDALDAWLNADASHRPLLSRYCQFSADLEEQLLALVATGGVQLPPEAESAEVVAFEPAPARTRRWNFPRVAGLALAAAAAVALAVWVARPAAPVEAIATAAAQRSSVTLTDGTRVELNAHTSLTFENRSTERRVRLARGEAFFSVAKDPSRPFIIETPAGSVRVTGTVFNVRAENSGDLEVTVVEGSVQVRPNVAAATPASEPFALRPNQCLSAQSGKTNVRGLSTDELADRLAWRQGQIVLRGVSVVGALERFAAYHGKTILPSQGVRALPESRDVGGTPSIDDLDGFLELLKSSFDLKVEHDPNGTIRVKLANEP